MEIKIDSLENIHDAAKKFIAAMGDNTVFAFYGKMGAGKTTFIKAVCEGCDGCHQLTDIRHCQRIPLR